MKLFYYLFFFSALIYGQNTVATDSITQLDEVILLDNLKTKNAIGITKSTVLAAKVFQNYSPESLVPALNQIPGVYVLSGALNTNRITIRGIGARTLFGTDKLRLYYNDIPITNGAGASTIEAFDLENLSQIEVIKGPKASSFGSNLGGAIILSPKKALGVSTSLVNNVTLGSYNMIKNNLSFHHFDGKLKLGLQYGHLETDGYRENNSFKRDGILLNSSYKIDAKNTINLLLNHVDYLAQIPSSLGVTAFNENPKQATYTWRTSKGFEDNKYTILGVNYQHLFNKRLRQSTSVFYSYLDHYEARPFSILDEFTNGFGIRTSFSGSFKLKNKSSNFTFGGELLKDNYVWRDFTNLYETNNGLGSLKGDLFAYNAERRQNINVFGSLDYPISTTLIAQVGFNLNATNYNFKDLFNDPTANKSGKRAFNPILLPNLNIAYTPNDNRAYYVNISRGFTNPNLEETLTPDGVINPDIAQETGVNYEMGSSVFFDAKKLHLNVSVYQMNIKNLLVAERINEDQYIGRNAGKTKHAGLELSATYTLQLKDKVTISPFLNYTYNHHRFLEFIDKGVNFSGNELTGVPENQITTGIQTRLFTHFYWNTVCNYVDKIPLTDANTLYSNSFTVVNSKIGYQQKLSANFTLGCDFGINNITNAVYAQSVLINTTGFGGSEPRYYYPGNNRNIFTSIRIGYKFK